MPYPEAINLPFNRSVIRDGFVPATAMEELPDGTGAWIIMHGDRFALNQGGEDPILHRGELPEWASRGNARVLPMGSWRGAPLRLALPDAGLPLPPSVASELLLMLAFTGEVSDADLSLAGLAQQLGLWERKSAFCPRCGGVATAIAGTRGKRCGGCGYEHFPSIYPCAIVLAQRGDEVLLIRKREWPPGYYSLPSGFCDLGECLEECAEREVLEETGVRIGGLRYRGSQCWPFPSQLMVAFTAVFEGGEVTPDPEELEDARWFSPDALPPTFSSRSVAGWLIEQWKTEPRTQR